MNFHTFSAVNSPIMRLEKYPLIDDNVFAKPKIVPEKFGAMSKPLPRYPAVTAPLNSSCNVKITTDHV